MSEHVTPMKQKFIDARRADGGVLIRFAHENSDEVLLITEGTKTVIPSRGYYCSLHGGFLDFPCPCFGDTRYNHILMWCDHGLVPPLGCVHCYKENPRNWNKADPPRDVIKPLTESMKSFNKRVTTWADGTVGLFGKNPLCPTPGCTAGSAETGRICSKLPHTSSPPSAPLSRDFSKDTTPDTIERRENYRLADGPLKELSWKGTLGRPPAVFKEKI